MRPEGNEAGESFLKPSGARIVARRVFRFCLPPGTCAARWTPGQVCNALEEGLEV